MTEDNDNIPSPDDSTVDPPEISPAPSPGSMNDPPIGSSCTGELSKSSEIVSSKLISSTRASPKSKLLIFEAFVQSDLFDLSDDHCRYS